MEEILETRPIFERKLFNNTEIGIGWRKKSGIPKFFTKASVGVCGLDMEVVLEMRPIFVRKLLNTTKLVLGEGIRLNPEICYLGLCWCLWLRYGSGFGNVPYIC